MGVSEGDVRKLVQEEDGPANCGRQKIGGRNLGEGMQGSSHKLADEPQSLGFFSAGKLKALIEVEHL